MATIQDIPGSEAPAASRVKINSNFAALNTELAQKATSAALTSGLAAKADASALTSGLAGKSDTSHTHSAATTSAPGFMSAADKTKLDGISESGTPGADGDDGWSPVFAIVTDSARRVLQIVDWAGGAGTKPSVVNQFIGASGIVSSAAAAVDIRGATGAPGSGAGDLLSTNNLSDLASAATARTNLGIGSVDNTADSAKPVSAAQAAADAAVQAAAVQRSNHTGTQIAATISDFTASARAQVEAALVAGANVTITPAGSGASRTLTIAASVSGGSGDVTQTGAQTLTNKRITKRASVSTTTATLTPNIDNFDSIKLTAQAENLAIANPTGTPTEDQALLISVKASGGARQITFGTAYAIPSGSSLASPYTLASGERIRFAFVYDSASAKWDIMTATPGLS